MDQDNQDETLRALEGFDRVNSQRSSNREQEEHNSDDSDLFLKLAREEASMNNPSGRGPIRRVCTFVIKSFFEDKKWIETWHLFPLARRILLTFLIPVSD